jgi:hypothetical protein
VKRSGVLPRQTVVVLARCPVAVSAVALATLALLVPRGARADRPAARAALVDAQPILDRVALPGQTPLVLRGRVTGAGTRWVREVPRELVADLATRFALRGRPDAPVDVCVFSSSAAYRSFARAVYPGDPDLSANGFYDPRDRLAVLRVSAGPGNLRHELVHVLVGDDYPSIPAWLNEGLGALYGTARRGPNGLEGLVNYRLRDLQAALRAGAAPSWRELTRAGHADVHGARAGVFYATARYGLLYLQARGRLAALYRMLADGPEDPAAHERALEAELDRATFERWASGLRWPPNAPPRL